MTMRVEAPCSTYLPNAGGWPHKPPGADEIRRQVSTVETHIHLGGAWPESLIRELAGADYSEIRSFLDDIKAGRVPYHEVFRAFDMVKKHITTREQLLVGVQLTCHEQIANNVTMVELRTGLKDMGGGLEDYLLAVMQGMYLGAYGSLRAGVVLSLRRSDSAELAQATVDLAIKHYRRGVVGVELSGISTSTGTAYLMALQRARSHGIPIALHIGEQPDEDDERQILELETLQPDRLGHCVYLGPQAREWVLRHKKPVEACLTSALLVMKIGSVARHPCFELMRAGVPVIFGTDDPLIFSTNLPEELALAAAVLGWSMEEIVRNQALAREHCFVQRAHPT